MLYVVCCFGWTSSGNTCVLKPAAVDDCSKVNLSWGCERASKVSGDRGSVKLDGNGTLGTSVFLVVGTESGSTVTVDGSLVLLFGETAWIEIVIGLSNSRSVSVASRT